MKTKGNQVRKWVLVLCMAMLVCFMADATVNAASKGFVFTYKKVSVGMNDKAASLIKKAGKPKKKSESKSCAFQGMDRTYTYADFTLSTYSKSKKGEEYVNGITLLTSKVSTKEGLKIGSSKNDMIKKYGKGKSEFGVYSYTKGKSKLMIEMGKNNKVSGIRYIAK